MQTNNIETNLSNETLTDTYDITKNQACYLINTSIHTEAITCNYHASYTITYEGVNYHLQLQKSN